MILQIDLHNFKTWVGDTNISLAPISLFLGTNSSGKSSIIQSLLLLKQTVTSPDRSIHLNLGGDESIDLLDLGDFSDIVSRGEKELGIGLRFQRDDDEAPLGFAARYRRITSGAPTLFELQLSDGERTFRVSRKAKGAYALYVGDRTEAWLSKREFSPERSISFSSEAIDALRREDWVSPTDLTSVQDIGLALTKELEAISYLGPLRRKARRGYDWNRVRPGLVGEDGRNAVPALIAAANAPRSQRAGSSYVDLVAEVSKWLNLMGLADRLEVRQAGGGNRYSVIIHRDGVDANLLDVGVGISQVLPVLVTAFHAQPGSTVLLEEPEIHLHPLAQSVLAELFVDVSRERKVQFVIETHSEHLFRRLQTLVAQQKVAVADVRLHFVERVEKRACLRELQMDPHGAIRKWPDKFFGDSIGEARQQALARAELARRSSGSAGA